MKKILLILAAVALTTVGCNKNQAPAGGETKPAAETTESDAAAAASSGTIAYFNVDSLISKYDMYLDLRAEYEAKAKKADAELTSKGRSLESDLKDYQNKIDKGLVTRSEAMTMQENLEKKLRMLGTMAEKYIDLDGLMALAESAGSLSYTEAFTEFKKTGDVRLAVAGDRAFCFYYADNLECLRRLGAELVFFSPLEDPGLPENIQGIYLGGGYPEVYAKKLSENTSMLTSMRRAAERKIPVLAECGGYMYLSQEIQDAEGKIWPMAGILGGRARMTESLGPFGYVRIQTQKESLIGNQAVPAHEFHYSMMEDEPEDFEIRKKTGRGWRGGAALPWLYGAYPHLYFYSCPEIPINFIQAMEAVKHDD